MKPTDLIAEYGFDPADATDSIAFSRAYSAPWHYVPRKYLEEKDYVRLVRAIRRSEGLDPDGSTPDARLIICGYERREPALAWARGRLDQFVAYWERAAERPHIVGSDYNPGPLTVYYAWRAGVPPHQARFFRVSGRHGWRMSKGRRAKFAVQCRAWSRGSAQQSALGDELAISPRLAWQLGRLCPELQRVAIETATIPNSALWPATGRRRRVGRHVIMPRDIDWAEVARMQAAFIADRTGRLRASYARSKRRAEILAAGETPANEAILPLATEGYDQLSGSHVTRAHEEISSRLARGESPRAISCILTRTEATEWLRTIQQISYERHDFVRSSPVDSALCYLARRYGWTDGAIGRLSYQTHGFDVVVDARPLAMIVRARAYYMEARIDEVCQAMREGRLDPSQCTTVAQLETFLARRLEDIAKGQRLMHLSPLPACPWWRDTSFARRLTTIGELEQEGAEQRHCVGSYVNELRRSGGAVIAVNVRGKRATAYVGVDRPRDTRGRGAVIEHRGRANSHPDPICERAIRAALRWSARAMRRAA